MPDITRPTEPGEDLDEAKRRLTEIKPPFVSLVDAAANLRPFLVVKEMIQMADEQTQNSAWILSSETKDDIVDTLGTASQMIGDLLAMARDAGESGEEMSGQLPEGFTTKIAEIVALLQTGESAEPGAESQAMALGADDQVALVQALEAALATLTAEKESVESPETKELPVSIREGSLRRAGEMIKAASEQVVQSAAVAAKAAADAAPETKEGDTPTDGGATAAKATQEQAQAVAEKVSEITDMLWSFSNAAFESVEDKTADDPAAAKESISAKLNELISTFSAAMGGADAPPAEDAEAAPEATEQSAEAKAEGDEDEEDKEGDAPTEKAGATFNKANRERLDKCVTLLLEAIDSTRKAPEPGDSAKAVKADGEQAKEIAALKADRDKIAKQLADAERVAKARPRSRVSQPDATSAPITGGAHKWCDDISDRAARNRAAVESGRS